MTLTNRRIALVTDSERHHHAGTNLVEREEIWKTAAVENFTKFADLLIKGWKTATKKR